VDVGASAVTVDHIGTFGQAISAVSIEYLIFGNVDGSAPLFTSTIGTISAEVSPVWHDSQLFTPFTLNANSTYWIGSAVSGTLNSFKDYYNDSGASDLTQNGLTIKAFVNGNVHTSFAAPTLSASTGLVQPGVRIFGPDTAVPEPGSVGLAAVALTGLALFRRSGSRRFRRSE